MSAKPSHRCPHPGCTKAFSGSWSLTRHLRKHSNLKPFKCSYCDKEFVEKCALSRHEQTHFEDHPWKCDFPDCGKHFKLKEYRDQHRKMHRRSLYQQPSENNLIANVADGEETGALENRPSTDQLRHRLVKLTIRHKEQLQRVEDSKRSYQQAFNECYEALKVIVANSDAAEISKLAQDHVADLKGLLSKHSGLVPGVAYSQSIVGLSQLSYVENASGALLALNKDSSLGSTNGPNKGVITAGAVLERLHGTISCISNKHRKECENSASNPQSDAEYDMNKLSSRRMNGDVDREDEQNPVGVISLDSCTDCSANPYRPSAIMEAIDLEAPPPLHRNEQFVAAAEIIDMLSKNGSSSLGAPGYETLFRQTAGRDPKNLSPSAPSTSNALAMLPEINRVFKKRKLADQDNHMMLYPYSEVNRSKGLEVYNRMSVQSDAIQDDGVRPPARAASGVIQSNAGQTSSTMQAQPSANIQNVVNWLVAWRSKKSSSSNSTV